MFLLPSVIPSNQRKRKKLETAKKRPKRNNLIPSLLSFLPSSLAGGKPVNMTKLPSFFFLKKDSQPTSIPIRFKKKKKCFSLKKAKEERIKISIWRQQGEVRSKTLDKGRGKKKLKYPETIKKKGCHQPAEHPSPRPARNHGASNGRTTRATLPATTRRNTNKNCNHPPSPPPHRAAF